MIPPYNGEEELGWPGIAVLALVVLAVSWLSLLVADAYLE